MRRIWLVLTLISLFGLTGLHESKAQGEALHQIEGRVRSQSAELRGIHVKLVLAQS